jgi:hypothetical protein
LRGTRPPGGSPCRLQGFPAREGNRDRGPGTARGAAAGTGSVPGTSPASGTGHGDRRPRSGAPAATRPETDPALRPARPLPSPLHPASPRASSPLHPPHPDLPHRLLPPWLPHRLQPFRTPPAGRAAKRLAAGGRRPGRQVPVIAGGLTESIRQFFEEPPIIFLALSRPPGRTRQKGRRRVRKLCADAPDGLEGGADACRFLRAKATALRLQPVPEDAPSFFRQRSPDFPEKPFCPGSALW